jgi:hypothetical protein
MIMDSRNFDDIRPFRDEEMQQTVQGLLKDVRFCGVLDRLSEFFPGEDLKAKLGSIRSIREFQHGVIYNLVTAVARKTTTSLDLSGFKFLDKSSNYVFVTNHRDIVLDSAFLDILLMDKGLETFEIAIGDNLLVYPWISDLVRLNKSFLVKRDLPVRQQMAVSTELSSYMHYVINQKRESIWVAQREGRAKDADDRTQVSVLKMLNLGGSGSVLENLASMNLVPVTISYEYDPCDYLKAREMQLKRDQPDYKKTSADDLMNMQTGIMGFKGRVYYKVSPCISTELLKMDVTMHKNELFEQIAHLLDQRIHLNYRLYPCNFIATDLLDGLEAFSQSYSTKEKDDFAAYIEKQLSKIELPGKDEPFLRRRMLEMYANPLKNKLKAEKEL